MVNVDDSVDVTETIVYDTGPEQRHGLYRDIRPISSQGRHMDISNVVVQMSPGESDPAYYRFTTGTLSGDRYRIKIGDPDKTFTGERTYVISYHAARAVGQTDTFDEIYWNVTGNEWQIPIYNVRASVQLPSGVSAIQNACYYGFSGETNRCDPAVQQGGSYVFEGPGTELGNGQGLTIAVGFPKGIVEPYSESADLIDRYRPWLYGAVLPVITFLACFAYWFVRGRDERKMGAIIPYYEVSDDLTPLEAAAIATDRFKPGLLSAEIIYLATRGYIKILQHDSMRLGIFSSTDYTLVQLRDFGDISNAADRVLVSGMFDAYAVPDESGRRTVKLSDLKNSFFRTVPKVILAAADGLKTKGFYKHLGNLRKSTNILQYVVLAVFATTIFGNFFIGLFGDPLAAGASVFVSIVIFGLFRRISPAKTEKGVTAMEHVLGLREYLQIAEKDRLEFHNAPERKPEVFERFLPYAMALGVAKVWAKEFADIYVTPPSWYEGSHVGAFNAIAFSNSLSSFSSSATSSMVSSPSSSGSGGGGSSGGGGGGGGGGGW